MKCPYCCKTNCEPPVVSINIENYGSKVVNFKCVHCKSVVRVYGIRTVKFGKPSRTENKSDW